MGVEKEHRPLVASVHTPEELFQTATSGQREGGREKKKKNPRTGRHKHPYDLEFSWDGAVVFTLPLREREPYGQPRCQGGGGVGG